MLLLLSQHATAVHAEDKPNVTLAGTPGIAPGPEPIRGDLSDGLQDLWLFNVAPSEGLVLYSAQIDGVSDTGGLIGFIEIARDADLRITRRDDIATKGLRPSLAPEGRHAEIGPLLLAPGEYVLGVTPLVAGHGDYRLRFGAQTATPVAADAAALPVGLWQGTVLEAPRCLALPVGAVDLAVWQAPGQDLTVWLQDADGDKHAQAGAGPVWRVSTLDTQNRQLCLAGQDATPWVAQIGPAQRPGDAHEPDDTAETAQILPVGTELSAQIDVRGAGRDKDTYVLAADTAGRSLRLTAAEGQTISYQLQTIDGNPIKSGDAGNEVLVQPYAASQDLALVVAGAPGTAYDIAYTAFPAPKDGEEAEPNDTIETATLWSMQMPATGTLDSGDSDFFQIDLTGPAQLWRVQADGAGVTRLAVHDVSGALIAKRRQDKGDLHRISNLYMIPGRYSVTVAGDGDYSLRLLPQGPRRRDVEHEPNDDAQELVVGQSLRGFLDPGDRDHFRFTVRATEWLTLRIAPPLGETISVYMLADGGEVFRQRLTGGHSSLDYTRAYQAGDYEVQIKNSDGLSGLDDYTISLAPSDQPFGPAKDREPNDFAHSAEFWPSDGRLEGRVGVVQQDRDAYRLRGVPEGADLRFCALPEAISISVEGPDGKEVRKTATEKTDAGPCEVYDGLAKGDHVVFVEQNSTGSRTGLPTDYRIVPTGLAPGQLGVALPTTPLGISVIAALPVPKSFLEGFAQHLPFAFAIDGYDSVAPLIVTLAGSEPGWSVGPLAITDQGAGHAIVETEIIAPPDLAEREIRLHLKLHNGLGRGVVSQVVTPDTRADPASPARAFAVPPALLGGFDMAGAQLGGRIVALDGGDLGGRDPDGTSRADALIDGLAIASNEFQFRHTDNGVVFNFALGGTAAVPLAGVLLTPRAAPGASHTLKDFAVEASTDGTVFTEVLRATLAADPVEQAFVFDKIVSARALRLRPLSGWTNDQHNEMPVRLGEFKAVASPGWTPDIPDAFNIADPALGGHVVWADPAGKIGRDWDRDLLLGDDTEASLVRKTDRMSVVIAFHHARAARIAGVDWTMATETLTARDAGRVDAVTLRASVTGPLGPWTEVAHWAPDLTRTADQHARLVFAQPIWARYLRFDMTTDTPAEYLRLPEQLRIWETPTTAEIPSILGEWGEFSQAAAYERLTAPKPPVIPASAGGATRALAVDLGPENAVDSSVERGLRADWWRIAPPDGAGELRLTLDTALQGGAHPDLFDADGQPVPVRPATEDEANARGVAMPLYLAPLAAGMSYALRIEEPLRPIVIAWDTSGSTAPYQPALQRALRDIALEADPDRDLIGFLPFGGTLLGNGLLGDPELLIRRLGNEPASGNSSNAERALAQSAKILADQDGVRGVILITDAASDRDIDLWDTLAKVRPRVGALAIPSTGAFARNPDRERDLMESWGRANGGFYQYVSTAADFTEGFARAVDRMRGPKPYHLGIGFGPAVPQPDGSLRVTETQRAETVGQPAKASLMVLLDTSGSMLQRVDGKPRYQIAREALAPLAAQANARGIAVGLRQFGIQPDACDTQLLAPVSLWQAGALTRVLDSIRPQNNARTPIAEALAAAGKDLANAAGVPRIVVLTDGEETCNGDPEQVIRALADQGIVARIDIVGFAIDDAALSKTFSAWARVGGGQYTNAKDADTLVRALLDVSQTQFRIRAADGSEAVGVVDGAALALAPGRYSLMVDGRPEPLLIDIAPGREQVIDLAK